MAKDRADAEHTTGKDRIGDASGRGSDPARKLARAVAERTEQVGDDWTRSVKDGLARYQDMFLKMPGFGGNGSEATNGTGVVAREELVELNTKLLSLAQGSLNEAFETSKAVINATSMQDAMQIQLTYARNAMQSAVEHAKAFSDLYAKAGREVAGQMSRGMHDAAKRSDRVGDAAADELKKQRDRAN